MGLSADYLSIYLFLCMLRAQAGERTWPLHSFCIGLSDSPDLAAAQNRTVNSSPEASCAAWHAAVVTDLACALRVPANLINPNPVAAEVDLGMQNVLRAALKHGVVHMRRVPRRTQLEHVAGTRVQMPHQMHVQQVQVVRAQPMVAAKIKTLKLKPTLCLIHIAAQCYKKLPRAPSMR